MRWRFCVESFAAEVRVELVDAARDSVVGSHRFGVLDLLQEQADQRALDYLKQAQSVIRANLPPGTQIPYLTQSESAKRYGSPPSSYYFEDPANSYLRDKSNLPTAVVTWPSARFTVFGDKLWWAPTPISVERPPQPEQFSIEISKQQQQSDWGAKELTPEQKLYAASDVLYLHRLKEVLERRLAREGRTHLAQASFEYLSHRAELDLSGWEEQDIFAHS